MRGVYPRLAVPKRYLFAQQPVGSDIWIALAWCVGILIVAYALAMATYHRRIS
jgi:ABC-2 type transport system permease protein